MPHELSTAADRFDILFSLPEHQYSKHHNGNTRKKGKLAPHFNFLQICLGFSLLCFAGSNTYDADHDKQYNIEGKKELEYVHAIIENFLFIKGKGW